MRNPGIALSSVCVVALASVSHAQPIVVDCSHSSLAHAVARARDKQTIQFTGVCTGPVVIEADGLTLSGVGTAVVDGAGQDAITIAGTSNVTLSDFEVRNGSSGIVGRNGAHLTVSNVSVRDNLVFGITLQTASSAVLSDVSTTGNGLHGLDVQTGSAVTVNDGLTTSANRVFGINVNGSAITFAGATVVASANALGIQIATNANAFINDPATTINVTSNRSTGLTVVSGAQLVSFGGAINATGNPVAGVSVNSKAGLDLDAGSTLTSANNGTGLLLQQDSVMTVFNNPQFSGVPGFSTVNANQNTNHGVRVLTGSTLTLSNQARILSTQNTGNGLFADNGSGVTLVNSTVTGNTLSDIQLTFGVRADLRTLTFGTHSCDATVLVRGTSGILCPQ